jgi:hypothetical protein
VALWNHADLATAFECRSENVVRMFDLLERRILREGSSAGDPDATDTEREQQHGANVQLIGACLFVGPISMPKVSIHGQYRRGGSSFFDNLD